MKKWMWPSSQHLTGPPSIRRCHRSLAQDCETDQVANEPDVRSREDEDATGPEDAMGFGREQQRALEMLDHLIGENGVGTPVW